MTSENLVNEIDNAIPAIHYMGTVDNISNAPYEIKAGDRIAQLLVMPSYRFKANVVDVLTDSDRGEGGFGSSGV
jgi:dUTPase